MYAYIPWNVKYRGKEDKRSFDNESLVKKRSTLISQLARTERGAALFRSIFFDRFRSGQASPLAETEESRGGCVVCGVGTRSTFEDGGGGEERRDDEKKKEKRNRGDEGRNVVGGCESVEHRNSINVEMGDFATVFWVVQSLVAKHEGTRSGCWSITWHDGESGRSRKGRRVLYIYIYIRGGRACALGMRVKGACGEARVSKREEKGGGERKAKDTPVGINRRDGRRGGPS